MALMLLEKTAIENIRRRFSCRKYLEEPIPPEKREKLAAFIASLPTGPFGAQANFHLVAATQADRHALKDLGTC
jgi:nitroreductase